MKDRASTNVEKIKKAYEIGKEEGLKYVYAGNIIDSGMENTECPKCGELVIEGDGYNITRYDKEGKCPKCRTLIEGIF